jgi:hypothetical protein
MENSTAWSKSFFIKTLSFSIELIRSMTPKYAHTPTATAAKIESKFLIGMEIAVLSDTRILVTIVFV